MARSNTYRWFTDPAARLIYPSVDHPRHGRVYTAQLREVVAGQGPGSRAAAIAQALLTRSEEFAAIWTDHEVGLQFTEVKRFTHPEVGTMDLHCQLLLDPDQAQSLLVLTATPGTQSYHNLHLLGTIGHQRLEVAASL